MHHDSSRGVSHVPYALATIQSHGRALLFQLKQCSKRKDLEEGKLLHINAIKLGLEDNAYVSASLIAMYTKCGSMADAQRQFDNTLQQTVASWTALILGYTDNGQSSMALDLFTRMDCLPDGVTFVAVLKTCSALASEGKLDKELCMQKGVSLHEQARERGFERDIFVANTLIDMYRKLGCTQRAREVFDRMARKDVISWSTLILGYAENGRGLAALEMFSVMDCAADSVTFLGAIKACGALASEGQMDRSVCVMKGRRVHEMAKEHGFEKTSSVANALVDMYSKCGDMIHARNVFDGMKQRDVVSWTALIHGYVDNGEYAAAWDVFNRMDCCPNDITFVSVLKTLSCLASDNKWDKRKWLEKGVRVHEKVRVFGLEGQLFVSNTLLDMYSKCGDMLQARDVFDRMKHRDTTSWSALMLGYVENQECSEALRLFNSMDCSPDRVTFVAALKACASLGALDIGQRIHENIRELGLQHDGTVASCLVDFYGKCGNMTLAREVFNSIHSPDIVSWTALVGGYSLLGDTDEVFRLMKSMEKGGLRMDGVMLLLVLSACSHGGKVEEAQRYFESMSKYGIEPTVDHYTCMVDIYGRANRLPEALALAREMPFEKNSCVWMTLLGACKMWSNLEIGETAFRSLVAHNDKEYVAAAYVLLRNIYEKLGISEKNLINCVIQNT